MAGGLARRRPSQPARLYRPRHRAAGNPRPLRVRCPVSPRTAGLRRARGRGARAPIAHPSVKEAPLLDIVVSGGLAVLPSGPEPADIGIAGEQIAAIGAPGSLAALGAGRVVDAAGQIVIPGGIDPPVHCSWPVPPPGVPE